MSTTESELPDASDPSGLADEALIALTREGHDAAFAELWSRYHRRALAVARRTSSAFDPEDLVAESFVRILGAIRQGGGPSESFGGYLYRTIHNVAVKWARAGKNTASMEDADAIPIPGEFTESLVLRDAISRVFESLPERWRKALWLSHVEGMSPGEMASVFDVKPTAAAMLTSRARQGFRKAWNEFVSERPPAQPG